MKTIKTFILFGLLAFIPMQANAHHSWASIFEAEGDAEIEGIVTKVLWRNPHVQFQITVDQGTPEETVWTIESNAVARLTRMGVSRDVIKVGDHVKAAGLPSIKGEPEMFVNHLLLDDKTEVVLSRTAGRRWESEATALIGDTDALHGGVVEEDIAKRPDSVFGSWHVIYGAEGSHRAGRASPDLTEYGQAYQDKRKAQGLDGKPDRHDCSPRQALATIGEPYPMALADNGDGTIEIQFEFLDTYRTVYMDADKPIPAEIPKDHLGYSRGHWLGETLVVESIFYREGGIDGDDYMQTVETFNLSKDHNRLNYSQVLIDPLMLSTPSVSKKWWQYVPGQEIQPYDCAGAI